MRGSTAQGVALGWTLLLGTASAFGQPAAPPSGSTSASPADAAATSPAVPPTTPASEAPSSPPTPPGRPFYPPSPRGTADGVRVVLSGEEEGLALYSRDDTRKWITDGYAIDT